MIVEVDGDADVRFQKGELRIYDADGKATVRVTVDATAKQEAERKIADWVLSIGGKVKFHVSAKQDDFIAATRDLPAGPLRIFAIDVRRSEEFNYAWLARLLTLSSL